MDEKYIKDIYDNFGEEVLGSFENFAKLISTDKEYQQEVYDGLGGEEIFGSYDNYSTLVKKKEPTDFMLESGLSGRSPLTIEDVEQPITAQEKEDKRIEEETALTANVQDALFQIDAQEKEREDRGIPEAGDYMVGDQTFALNTELERSRDRDNLEYINSQVDREIEDRKALAEEAQRERDRELAATANENKQALMARESRGVARRNDDGTSSTHLMMSYEEDGVFKVAPTLFPKEGTKPSPNPSSWTELPFQEAIDEANRRGEVYTFSTEEEANAFAEGSWKYSSTIDVEGERFFAERGLNYADYIKAETIYNNLLDENDDLESFADSMQENALTGETVGYIDDLLEDEKEEYDIYFDKNGRFNLTALERRRQEISEESSALRELIGAGTEEFTAREDFDVVLEEQNQRQRDVAAEINKRAKEQEALLAQQSMTDFGIPPEELIKFQPRDEYELNKFKEIVGDYLELDAIRGAAALEYDRANSYLNAKQNKSVQGEYRENLEGFNTEWHNGLVRGQGAEVLLRMALGDIDINNEEELLEAVANLIRIESMRIPNDSRVLSRFNRARTPEEWKAAIKEDPAEFMVTLAASSLSQVLPYGTKILAATVGAGVTQGVIQGAITTGTPQAAVIGGLGGAGKGLALGMSVNSFIMEYTSAILEAVNNKGYDARIPSEYAAALKDPEVWAEANDRGVKRGLAIAAVDYFGMRLAGRVFVPASAEIVGMGARGIARGTGYFVAERAIFDPAVEGFGEALAQRAVGDELRLKDIVAEMGGAGGNQATAAAVQIAKRTIASSVQNTAQDFLSLDKVAFERSTDKQITNWTNRQVKLKKITPEQGQRILENVGLRREARDLMSVSAGSEVTGDTYNIDTKEKSTVMSRMMQLLEAREQLSATPNRKNVYADKIRGINEELRYISETGKVPPVEEGVNLYFVGPTRASLPSYRIGRRFVPRAKFIEEIEKASPRRLRRIANDAAVRNDPEASKILNDKIRESKDEKPAVVSQVESLLQSDLLAAPGETTVAAEAVAQDVAVEEAADVDAEAAALEAELLQTEQTQDDAIQEPSTETVPAQEPSADSAEVGEGVPATEQATEQAQAEDQATEAAVEEEVDEQDVLYDKAIEDAPDNVVDLYDKWLSVLFSPEMDAITEKPSVDRTRAESAKVGAMTRRMRKAMEAAKDAGISSRDANILMRAVQRKFTKSQDTDVIEAAPVSEETFVGEFQSNEVADALIDEAVSKATPKKKAAAKKKAPATKPTPQPTPATKQVVETKEEVAVDETSVQEIDSEIDKSREDFKAKKLGLENDIEALQNKRKALPKKKITPTKKALQAAEISKDIQAKTKAIKALERSYNAESTRLSVRKAAAKQATTKKKAAPTKKAAPVAKAAPKKAAPKKAAPKRKAAPKATKGKSMSELAQVDITALPEQELMANLKELQEITKKAVKAKDKKQETIGRTGIRVYKAEIARRATEETKPAAKKKAAPAKKAAPIAKAAPAKKSDTKNIDAQIKKAKQKLKKNPKSEEIIAELRSLNKQLRTIENDAKKPLIENYRNEAMWGKAIGEWSSNFTRQERLIAESEAKTPTQFQLQVDTKVNQEEIDSMKRLMDEANLESEASVVEPPVMETIPIIVEENGQLVAKVARVPLSFLEGKLVNLAMADQLKVADGSMGGPFFSLQEGIFGKVAWASIDKSAAMSIIRGAAVGDYTVVFNMLPSAVDSNVVSLEYAMGLINSLEDGPQVFADMMQRIQERKFNRKGEPGRTEKVHEMAQTVKNSDEFVKAFEKLGVDLRADITKAIFPTEKTNPKNEYLKRLKSEGITLENIRAANAEQAVADLPMGAMTVVLEVTDKEGNKITMDNLDDALMTVEEQEAEGIPTHRNYPFYIRGRVVAVLEDTTPFWSVMPEVQDIINKKVAEQIGERDVYEVDMDGVTTTVKVKDEANNTRTVETYNSAGKKIDSLDRTISIDDDAREFIEANYGAIISEKKGGTVSPATARSDAYRSAMMSATSVAEVNAPAVSDVAAFVARLSSAFPGVEVVTTQKEFDAMVKEQGTKGLTTQSQKVYGAVVDGTVFLNPKLENYNTPVHEFGHLWMNTAKELNPEAYRRGIELVADSDYVRQVKESADYIRILKRMKRDGSTEQEINDYVLEEALALAIGNKGESFVKAAQQRSFKTWLNDLFNFVKGLVGISNISSADLQNLTLDEFSSAVVVDLMSENEIFAQAEVARLSDSVQFMIGPNQDASLTQVVEMGRERGYSDAAIKKLLLNRGAHTAEQINDALFEAYTKSVQVPAEFGNAVGGMNVGRKIFTDVRKGLKKYIKNYTPPIKKTKDGKEVKAKKPEKTKDGKEIKPTPTRSQLRAEAMRLLTENIAFEKQPLAVREKLISAFDRSLGITASKDISQQVSAIRNNIRQRAKGAATLQQAKKALTTFIKETLPKSGTYSNSQINKLNSRVAKATEASLLADMEYVLKQVEVQNNKIKKQVLKDLYTLARRDTKARLSIKGNKDKAADVGADAREFAGVFAQTLKAAMQTNQTAVMEISQILDGPEAVDALSKYIKGIETLQSEQESLSQLTTPEKKLVFQALAYQRLRDVSTMSLDEVNQLYMDFAIGSLNERIILNTKRHDRQVKNAERNDRLNAELRENHPDLFTADGKPLNVNDRNRLRDSIKEAWNDRESGLSGNLKGLVAASKAFYENFNFTESAQMLKSILQNLKHLGTFMNVVGKGFKEEVYGRLNRAEERSLQGYFEQTENVMNGIALNAGFESYVDMARQLYEAPPIKLEGIKRGDSTLLNKDLFSKNQLMRIYALSLNDVQRAKLAEQGLDFDNPQRAAEIEGILGPELMQVARETVEYLSSDYYESVNKVKRNVDDINMRYIPNYFPTQTVVTGQEANISHEDFGAQFSADNHTAMMNRNNVVSDVKLKGADFTSTLDSHFKDMERYKAYAYDVRSLQSLFNTEDFQSALTSLGIKSLVLQSMNIAINPDAAAGNIKGEKLLSWATTAYVGIALSFKAVQIIKQATSAINAFPTYVHNKDGKRRPTDIFFWMMDYAHVLANPKKYLKIAEETSATFKMRRKLGRKGEVAGLEGGSPTRAGLEQRSRITRAYRTVAGAGTYVGDISGVMGYMANHRRNLINGMDADTARDKFNDYNDSQQSRRGTERSIIQQNANPLIKLVTQFGSSSMLYINNTMQAGTNIIRDIKKGKKPSAEDIRKFYINLGTANVLFVAMSNLPLLLMGTSDEREEVYKKMLFAQLGLNLLNFIPSLAATASMIEGWATGKPSRQRAGLGIDPFTYIQRRMGKSKSTEDQLIKAMQLVLDVVFKTNTDTFIAGGKVLRDIATGDLNDADDALEAVGFSKSYRPEVSKSKGTPQVKTRSEKREAARERRRNNR